MRRVRFGSKADISSVAACRPAPERPLSAPHPSETLCFFNGSAPIPLLRHMQQRYGEVVRADLQREQKRRDHRLHYRHSGRCGADGRGDAGLRELRRSRPARRRRSCGSNDRRDGPSLALVLDRFGAR